MSQPKATICRSCIAERTTADQSPPGARNSFGATPPASVMADCASVICWRIVVELPRLNGSGWVMLWLVTP